MRGCDEALLIGDELCHEDAGDVEEEAPPRLWTGTYLPELEEEVDESDLSERAGEAARAGMAMGLDISAMGTEWH